MPNSFYDLHLHTYYSDGRASPAEVLRYAAEIGLKVVAITDHDSLEATREAANTAAELGLEVIPAIELTTQWDACPAPDQASWHGQDVDLLGYFIDPDDREFKAYVQRAFEDMRQRTVECCRLLTKAGYPVSISEVEAENPRYPGAMQLISALHHKGLADNWNQAYTLFTEYWQRVRSNNLPIEEAIHAVHAAGGIAVLAHPIAIRCRQGWLQAGHLAPLVEAGLDGLEVLHPSMDAEAREHFRDLAQQFDLLVTGGSDEHGVSGSYFRMGSEPVSYEIVMAMRERARQRKQERVD